METAKADVVSYYCNQHEDFKGLSRYFDKLKVEHLFLLEEDDIVQSVDREDRMLTRIFYKNVLLPLLTDPFKKKKEKKLDDQIFWKDKYKENEIMDLRGKVVGKVWKKLGAEGQTLDEKKISEEIKFVDLSSNNLADSEVDEIYQFLSGVPLDCVNLSNNRLSDLKSANSIYTLLDKGMINKIVICGNPLASSNQKDDCDFFKDLNKEQLERLIWIPKNWLQAGGWKHLIDEKFWVVVEETHNNFYL